MKQQRTWIRKIKGWVRRTIAESSTLVVDSGFYEPGADLRDRVEMDRALVLEQALQAWRVNPLARRIVELTSQYVVGGGVSLSSTNRRTQAFLQSWWQHPLNQFPLRVSEWCDELTRSGELFLLLSTDAAGMSFVRAVPASQIEEIRTAKNDIQQELAYVQKAGSKLEDEESRIWTAYQPLSDGLLENGQFQTVMLHFAINRPVGAVHGESDLAPLLRWLSRYAACLEDRARLNRYRTAFYYVVKSRFLSETERAARQTQLSAAPPTPGSILVTDESESWEVLSPKLESDDAAADGLALKKMIAAGAGVPLHFLAEPESATRTTAESAGGPTYRHFEQRQEFFLHLLGELARAALRRRALVDRRMPADAPIEVRGADLSARDNASLAIATTTITNAFLQLYDRGLIDHAELLRMIYRFAGEQADVAGLIERSQDNPGNPELVRPATTKFPSSTRADTIP
ncbi:MAG: hypothetical protein ABFD29_05880 [Anaerolineaceae bacterium]